MMNVEHNHGEGCDCVPRIVHDDEVERLRMLLAESERVSAERQQRLIELRDALIKIETASRKLGIAPGYLGDMAGRALARRKAN